MLNVEAAPAPAPERLRIGDLQIDRAEAQEAMSRIQRFVESRTPHQVVTANMRYLTLAHQDPRLAAAVNASDLVVADGMPLIWLSRLLGRPIAGRVTGSDILKSSAAMAAERGYSIYLLGAAPGVAEDAANRLRAMHPSLKIAGTHHGYFKRDEEPDLISAIRDSGADFLFVAMGVPRQDFWIHDNLAALGVPVCVGIGGTLEVLTDRLKRAPGWVQKIGMEWLYRVMQEPRRLWRRYFIEDLPMAFRITASALIRRSRGQA